MLKGDEADSPTRANEVSEAARQKKFIELRPYYVC
jgi:hypothetical protein